MNLIPGRCDVISTKSRSVPEMERDLAGLGDEQTLELIVQEPRLFRRPLMVVEGELVIGLDRERLERLLR